jgi:hypothetical protein
LLRAAAHESDARRLLDALRGELPAGVGSLCLRPRLACGGGSGVVRIATAGDLRVLASALARRAPAIPASMLSLPQPLASSPLSVAGLLGGAAAPAAGGAAAVPLPPGLPDAFVVEPWVETDPVEVAEDNKVRWAGKHRWVEVVIGVVGAGGDAAAADAQPHALPPVLLATSAGRRAHLCPAPSNVLSPAASEAAQRAALRAAAAVAGEGGAGGGGGAAPPPGLTQVDAFCHADTGDLLVLDVRARPSLCDGHPLLLAASRAGVRADELARRAADAALAAGARAFAQRGGGARGALGSGGAPAYWATGGGEAGAALFQEEEEVEGGDILAGAPSFVGGDTDAEEDNGGGEAGWTL